MIHTISIFIPADPDSERRCALAKVYSLLIRLAEETENHSASTDTAPKEEKIVELNSCGRRSDK